MKKLILFPLTALLLCACTTKEQEQQIRLFWLQQYAEVLTKQLAQQQTNDPDFNDFLSKIKSMPSANKTAGQLPGQPETTSNTQPRPATPRKPAPQIMEVTLDTDALPGRATQEDRVKMKRALEAVQLSNQSTLNDIAATFGDNVKYQAFLLTADTERKLKKAASSSADFNAYLAAQNKLLQTQNQKLNQLMQQNASSIKNIRR